jgi:uncharacterized protein (DUF2147 family)
MSPNNSDLFTRKALTLSGLFLFLIYLKTPIMKLFVIAVLMSGFLGANAQDIVGKWKTIDDNSGDERSVVEIYEKAGRIYGRIIKLYRKPGEDPDPICDECDHEDSRYKKKIIGMEIIAGMKRNGNEYDDGNILDPETGKIYRCKLWMEENTLKVRGYWGPFFRTQTWKKLI